MATSKMGRPTDNPKEVQMRIRLSKKDSEKLNFCSDSLKINKSDVVRMGIDKIYQELKE